MGRRAKFDTEFRCQAVEMARVSGRPRYQVAADLGISDTTLAKWMTKETSSDEGGDRPLSGSERDHYEQLVEEKRIWVMEREILKKSAAFWVKELNG